MKMDAVFWVQSITIVLFGIIGALLFKLQVNHDRLNILSNFLLAPMTTYSLKRSLSRSVQ